MLLPAGWNTLVNQLAVHQPPTQPLAALYVAASTHKLIACYCVTRPGSEPLYAGLLHAGLSSPPVELAYFHTVSALEAWIASRGNHDALRKRKPQSDSLASAAAPATDSATAAIPATDAAGLFIPAGFYVSASSLDALGATELTHATAGEVERIVLTTDLVVVAHSVLDVLCFVDCPTDGDAFLVYATSNQGDSCTETSRCAALSDALQALELLLANVWDLALPLRPAFRSWR